MAVKLIQIWFIVLAVSAVLCQPDVNRLVWNVFCTGNFPAEPSKTNHPLSMLIYPDPFSRTFPPNFPIRVTLRGKESTFNFAAFLIQAHKQSDPSVKYGRWESGALGRPISCSHPDFEGNDAAAQNGVVDRHVQDLVWFTPEQPGNYVLNLTISQEFGVYWIDQLSPVLRVALE